MAGFGENIPLGHSGLGAADITIVEDEPGEDVPTVDDSGNVLEIEHADGSITISLDGKPIDGKTKDKKGWFDNLVDQITNDDLSSIAERVIRGVEEDNRSRTEWMQNVAEGMKLLGLKIELPNTQGSQDGAPVEGMSKVRAPILLESILRFQANSRSELLPTNGPVKIRIDSNNTTAEEQLLAEHYEKDFNHFLTVTADEYYPDTDRMLFTFGFSGLAFKKVYFCPIRNRPVSEMVDVEDLIVSNSATSLRSTRRYTHRITMSQNTVKRMQILDIYRDVELGLPMPITAQSNPIKEEKSDITGVTTDTMFPEDRDREIYETYCELNLNGFEHKKNGKITGLEIPYRVTIDLSSRQVLSIVRNYDQITEEMPIARQSFVVYVFVPGFGFYPLGLLNILGNLTNTVTAAWRELLDSGMYASFPGFLYSDAGGRQNTNIFRVPPGGGAQVKTGGMPINNAVMPLPYKEPSTALEQMADKVSQYGQRLGGTSEMPTGEGNLEAPVGTTIAMIEQATKVMNAVHKRMHSAQATEFQLLAKCFREHPDSFWKYNDRPARQWDEAQFRKAVDNFDLVPQADPNTASHVHRLMKVTALKQLQKDNPNLYDAKAVDTMALRVAGWDHPEEFFAPTEDQKQPPPEVIKGIEELKLKDREVASTEKLNEAKAASLMAEVQNNGVAGPPTVEDQIKMMEIQTDQKEMDFKERDNIVDAVNRKRDRESRERLAMMKLATEMADNPTGTKKAIDTIDPAMLTRLEGNEPDLPGGLS
jgi:hypothetical protein